jgi:vacuolar-type H+-ATPase subunit H
MTELLSILIASIFAASIGLRADTGGDGRSSAKEARYEARTSFKDAEKSANADYKVAIADCRKKKSADRPACLSVAQTTNAEKIVAAKATMDRILTERNAL